MVKRLKILVTGGAGFIGSHLVERLLSLGHNLVVLDDLSTGKLTNIPIDCEFIQGSVNDTSKLENAIMGADFCFHLAAIASVQKSIDDWQHSHFVNLSGTIAVFLAASKLNIPVIYASSAAIYGTPVSLPIAETHPVGVLSPYGADKYSCELQAKAFGTVKGLQTLGMRFFNVYGPRQDPESPYSGVISIFAQKIANDEPITIFGDGSQERDFIYVDDVVDSLLLAMEHTTTEGPVYNVCTGLGTNLQQLVAALAELTSKQPKVVQLLPRVGDIHKSIGSPHKLMKNFNYHPKTSLKTGLEILIKSSLVNLK